jgi:hypothetical protein
MRSQSLPLRLTEKERRRLVIYPNDVVRPRTRSECGEVRPCPFVSCRHHLYLDVHETSGRVKMNFPHLEVDELEESCSLDVAERGGVTLDTVGRFMNITRERIRQLEVLAVAKAANTNIEMEDPKEVDRDELPELPTRV